MNYKTILMYFFLLVGVLSVFYFSWLPNPNIGLKPYFPKAIGTWINEYGNLRTAVPFLMLGGIGETILVNSPDSWRKRSWVCIILLAVVTLAELGQLLLPRRHFDWADIGWGAVGSGAGMAIAVFLKMGCTTNNA